MDTARMVALTYYPVLDEQGNKEAAVTACNSCNHLEMQEEPRSLMVLLRACANRQDLQRGSRLHADIIKMGLLENNAFLASSLVSMYAKCGSLTKAQELSDKLTARDVVSWSALIAGYAQYGNGDQALNCFEQMQLEGFSPDAVTYACILKACGNIGASDKGQDIHLEILRQGRLDVVIGNVLVDMYFKCGLIAKAQEVFDQIQARDVVLWSTLIAGYAKHGHGEQALNYFGRMRNEGLSPNAITFLSTLQACGCVGAVSKGQEIHTEIVRNGLLETNIFLGNALVDMYVKCGLLAKGQEVFDKLPVRNVVLWSTLIAGYVKDGHASEQALNCFEQMQLEGFYPDVVTFLCILKACGLKEDRIKGQEIHAEISKEGLLEKNINLGNGLVDMYGKCGMLEEAQEVFDNLPVRDVVLWSTLISGYAQHGHGEQALHSFEQMQFEGHSPNAVTSLCVLKACGSIGAIDKGREVHSEIVKDGLLGKDILIGTALVDMYAKCGLLAKAQEVFDNLPVRDVVLWNALIAGKTLLGKVESVSDLFDKMTREGLKPDLVTFTLVLNACSHAGRLDKGIMYFETMSTCHSIIPTLDHYTCMVDIFSRAGHLDKAVTMIKDIPFSANLMMWHIVLNACQKWRNVTVARVAFEHAVQLDEKDAGAYVCMSNIYADAGRQEDADKVEMMRVEKQAWTRPGVCWWTESSIQSLLGVEHMQIKGTEAT